MLPQLHVSRQNQLIPRAINIENDDDKPAGAFWTSSINEDGISDWIDWTRSEQFYDKSELNNLKFFKVIPSMGAKVFCVDSKHDYDQLVSEYYVENFLGQRFPDYIKLAEMYDGIQITINALTDSWPGFFNAVNGWACESTAWLRWKFDKVEEYTLPCRGKMKLF